MSNTVLSIAIAMWAHYWIMAIGSTLGLCVAGTGILFLAIYELLFKKQLPA